MKKTVVIPAITREIEFISRNAAVADQIWESQSGPLFELTYAVWERACASTDVLLRKLEEEVAAKVRGILRINWANTNRGNNWESWARVFMPKGPERRMATAGLHLGENLMALRLVGWMWPRWGGLDGRRELVRVCRKKIRRVCLASEYPARYPGWSEDDAVVWYDHQISIKSSLAEVAKDLGREARTFFKTARPVLVELANR
jgi:hypothetical protein